MFLTCVHIYKQRIIKNSSMLIESVLLRRLESARDAILPPCQCNKVVLLALCVSLFSKQPRKTGFFVQVSGRYRKRRRVVRSLLYRRREPTGTGWATDALCVNRTPKISRACSNAYLHEVTRGGFAQLSRCTLVAVYLPLSLTLRCGANRLSYVSKNKPEYSQTGPAVFGHDVLVLQASGVIWICSRRPVMHSAS